MKSLIKKFEAAMMAAAFAEEGEFETAREVWTMFTENAQQAAGNPGCKP